MTNGEKLKEIFPDVKIITQYDIGDRFIVFTLNNVDMQVNIDWWNAEYKESTTKNNLPYCQHTDEEIAKSFIEDVEAVKEQLPCGEQMDFPDTFDEFAKHHQIVDKDEHYSNGIEYIPVFRVKQWLEHIATTKNNLEVDCISRISALDSINWAYNLSDAYQKINDLPPIRPKGHWIEYSWNDNGFGRWGLKCDKCHKKYKYAGEMWGNSNFCPNCGADMREVKE